CSRPTRAWARSATRAPCSIARISRAHRPCCARGAPMTVAIDARDLDLRAFVRPGDRIVWGQACGEPTTLVEALVAQAEHIGGAPAFAATSFSGRLTPEAATRFRLSSMGAMGALRAVAAANKLDIVPCHVSQVAPMIERGLLGCDVAFVQVSPPDA